MAFWLQSWLLGKNQGRQLSFLVLNWQSATLQGRATHYKVVTQQSPWRESEGAGLVVCPLRSTLSAEIPYYADLLHLVCIPQPAQGSGLWKIPPLWHSGGMKGEIKGGILVTATEWIRHVKGYVALWLKVIDGPVGWWQKQYKWSHRWRSRLHVWSSHAPHRSMRLHFNLLTFDYMLKSLHGYSWCWIFCPRAIKITCSVWLSAYRPQKHKMEKVQLWYTSSIHPDVNNSALCIYKM